VLNVFGRTRNGRFPPPSCARLRRAWLIPPRWCERVCNPKGFLGSRGAWFAILLALSSPTLVAAQSDIEHRAQNVVFIYSHEREMATYVDFDRELRAHLDSGPDHSVAVYTEYLDLMRFSDEEHQKDLVSYLHEKYASQKIDLVFAVSPLALTFLLEHGQNIFPGVPVVFASANVRTIEKMTLAGNVTGVAVKRRIADTLDLALRLQPETSQIVIPAGNSTPEKVWIEDLKVDLRPYQDRVTITWLTGLPMQAMLTELHNLPPHTIVLFANVFFYDAVQHYYLPDEALELICRYANAPVYSTNVGYLGTGILGGHMLDLAPVGAAAGDVGRRILAGELADSIPVQVVDPNRDMFDARQLQRWAIDRNKLPQGSVVLFEPPSVWRLYKKYILAATALFLFQAWLILVLTKQGRQLKKSECRLRDLSKHLIHAQDAERMRIARELHDDFAQRLAMVSIDLDALKGRSEIQQAAGDETLSRICSHVTELGTDIHDLSHRLHSSRLQYLGLRPALKQLCTTLAKQHKLRIELQGSGPDPAPISEDIALCFYRVAQEALHNAVKYSCADQVLVDLTNHDSTLRMQITDSGKGFDERDASGGIGLMSMQERVRTIGGTFEIRSKPGQGTQLTVQVRRRAAA